MAQFLVQPVELRFTHLGKVVDGLAVDTPAPRFAFTRSQAISSGDWKRSHGGE